VWIATQTTDDVTIVGTAAHDVRGRVPVGRDPNWIEMTPDGSTAVVSNTGGNSVTLIDVRGRRVIGTVPVGPGPKRLMIMPETARRSLESPAR
jgi:YVTN family beta-propeller protein